MFVPRATRKLPKIEISCNKPFKYISYAFNLVDNGNLAENMGQKRLITNVALATQFTKKTSKHQNCFQSPLIDCPYAKFELIRSAYCFIFFLFCETVRGMILNQL